MASDKLLKVMVEKLNDALREIPDNMQVFSRFMRDLYVDNNFATHPMGEIFNQILNETKTNAMVYGSILPSFELIIKLIKSFFSNYEDKDYDAWSVSLSYSVKELKVSKEHSDFVKHMHEEMVNSFKKTEKNLLTYTQPKNRPEEKGTIRQALNDAQLLWNKVPCTLKWFAVGASYFHLVELLGIHTSTSCELASASLLTLMHYCVLTKVTMLLDKFFNNNEDKVIKIVSSALEKFMVNFYTVIRFFGSIEREIIRLQTPGRVNHQELRSHYDLFKGKAKDILKNCLSIITVVPNIQSNIVAIPAEDKERLVVKRRVQEMQKTFLSTNPYLTSVTEVVLGKCVLPNVPFEDSCVNVGYKVLKRPYNNRKK